MDDVLLRHLKTRSKLISEILVIEKTVDLNSAVFIVLFTANVLYSCLQGLV